MFGHVPGFQRTLQAKRGVAGLLCGVFAQRSAYPFIAGFSLCQAVLCSYACAIFKIVSSPNGFPSNCNPIGSFGDFVNPQGTLMPQMPARLQEIVKMSERYICSGSSDFSPTLNAAVGVVGVTMASTFSN